MNTAGNTAVNTAVNTAMKTEVARQVDQGEYGRALRARAGLGEDYTRQDVGVDKRGHHRTAAWTLWSSRRVKMSC